MYNILFVCLGNICRSPSAEAVMKQLITQNNLNDKIQVASCGTGQWHIGQAPDPRAISTAKKYGYDMSAFNATQIQPHDFKKYDLILAMDQQILTELKKMSDKTYHSKIKLFLTYAGDSEHHNVNDPFHQNDQAFDNMFLIIQEGCKHVLSHVCHTLSINKDTLNA